MREDERRIEAEFAGAKLGDRRLMQRLGTVASRAMAAPGAGFPQMMASDAELEGVYRLLNNERVTFAAVIAPHVEATLKRAADQGTCLVLHDTTSFEFGGETRRDGLGLMIGNGQGFFAHVSLAVAPGDARLPLGVCAIEHWSRQTRKGSNHSPDTWRDPNRESLRWARQLEKVESLERPKNVSWVHVMDREGDIFDVLASARALKARFVIRSAHDRALHNDAGRIRERVAELPPAVRREIDLNARVDRDRPGVVRKRHPKRDARKANIAIAACTVDLRPSHHAEHDHPVTVNLVHVWEPSPPTDQPPIDWLLYTTEPINDADDLVAIVDIYRSRWVIEEYFRVLKTGCAFERRQLESFHALLNALALFIPVAWQLLLARSLCRVEPNAPADSLLTPVQLKLIAHQLRLSSPPETVLDATYAVAKLGGHLRRNGMPGWQTLCRGYEALLIMGAGWAAAIDALRSDQ